MPSEKKAWEMPEHVLHFGKKQEKLIVVCPDHLISRNISEEGSGYHCTNVY